MVGWRAQVAAGSGRRQHGGWTGLGSLRAPNAPLCLVPEAWAGRRPSAAAHPPVWRAATRQGLEGAAADPQWTGGVPTRNSKPDSGKEALFSAVSSSFPCTKPFTRPGGPPSPITACDSTVLMHRAAGKPQGLPRRRRRRWQCPSLPLCRSSRRCRPTIALTCPFLAP